MKTVQEMVDEKRSFESLVLKGRNQAEPNGNQHGRFEKYKRKSTQSKSPVQEDGGMY